MPTPAPTPESSVDQSDKSSACCLMPIWLLLAKRSSPNDDVLQLAVKTVQMFSLFLATVLLGKKHYV